jgi:hypothetical protein
VGLDSGEEEQERLCGVVAAPKHLGMEEAVGDVREREDEARELADAELGPGDDLAGGGVPGRGRQGE